MNFFLPLFQEQRDGGEKGKIDPIFYQKNSKKDPDMLKLQVEDGMDYDIVGM